MQRELLVQSQNEQERRRWEKWKHVIYAADALSKIESEPESIKRIMQCLEGVEEVFPSSADPVEDLEAFALRRLVKELRAALTKLERRPVP